MVAIHALWAWWSAKVAEAKDDPDRGEVQGWVIVVAVTVVLALAIGAIIVQKVTDKANSIDLQ